MIKMFGNEEFDLDEDFLNDITQKESQYYSQTLSSDEERCVKKFKNDNNGTSERSNNESIANFRGPFHAISEENVSVANSANDIGNDTTVRTNSILERLKRHKNISSESNVVGDKSNSTSNPTARNSVQESCSSVKKDKSRKNLILEIFRRNNVESSSAGPSTSFEVKSQMNNVNVDNRKIEQCKTIGKSLTKSAKQVYKPVTLVRQFPGPAGLLPDLSSELIPQALLESPHTDDSNDSTDVDVANDSKVISNYYSQNTTSLFNDGPWQSLTDDLSDGFLNGHEIVLIKQKVLTNSYKNNKVPFLAGIVQKVDFSRSDPTVVLKDCTGTIEGTICKDILVKYPHSLDIGAVLFLGNVALLTIGSYLKKFHVVVTVKNIINIYAGKTKIFNTSEMNARLEDFGNNSSRFSEPVFNQILNSTHSLNSEFNSRPNIDNVRENESRNSASNYGDTKNSYDSINNSSHHTIKNTSDNAGQSVVSNKLPVVTNSKTTSDNSFINKNGSKSLETKHADQNSKKFSFQTDYFEDVDDDFIASFLDIDNSMISETSNNIVVSTVDNASTKDSIVISNEYTEPNTVNLNVKRDLNLHNNDVKKSDTVEKKLIVKKKQSPVKSSNVKLKLSVFRSNSELTQPHSEDIDSILSNNNTTDSIKLKKENKDHVHSNSTSNLLLNRENDSDEEIFSQLDIESIVSNYNNSNNVN